MRRKSVKNDFYGGGHEESVRTKIMECFGSCVNFIFVFQMKKKAYKLFWQEEITEMKILLLRLMSSLSNGFV